MSSKADEDTWFALLGQIHPVTGYLRIGAGSGRLLAGFGLEAAPRALLVEAEESRLRNLEAMVATRSGWSVASAVVAPIGGTVVFHRAGSPNESGLVAPARLNRLWPNLGLVQEQERTAVDIATLLAEAADGFAEAVNWLHVDCLPARDILAGAGASLQRLDVIVARVLLDAAAVDDGAALGSAELGAFLAENGFRSIATFPERHPALAQAVHVRDTKRQIARIREASTRDSAAFGARIADLEDRLRQEVMSREAMVAQLTDEVGDLHRALRDGEAREQELADRIASATEAWRGAHADAARCAEQVAALTRIRDDLTEVAEARAAEIDTLAKARDEQAARASEFAVLVKAVEDAKTFSDRCAAELEALVKVRDEQAARAETLASEVASLGTALVEARALADRRMAEIEAATKACDEQAALTEALASEVASVGAALVDAKALADRRMAEIEAATKACDEQAALAEARGAELAMLVKAAEEAKKLADRRAAEVDTLVRLRDEQATSAEARAAEIVGLKREAADAAAALASCRDEAARAEKLTRLRQADLDDLRRQYAALHDRIEAREGLLADLRANLGTVSEMLAKRRDDGPESSGDVRKKKRSAGRTKRATDE